VQHGENIAKGFGNQQKGLGTSGFLGLKMIVASDALGLWGWEAGLQPSFPDPLIHENALFSYPSPLQEHLN
jgi:hypothetical protein